MSELWYYIDKWYEQNEKDQADNDEDTEEDQQ
jgi:hypothetical protein